MDDSLSSNNVDEVGELISVDDLEPVRDLARLTSDVWKNFDRKRSRSTGVCYAVCKLCDKPLSGKSSSGTSHLAHHHTKCLAKQTREKDCEEQSNKKAKTEDTWSFDQAAVRKTLGLMIILHDYPLAMVEHEGFKDFMSIVQPLFKSVSRNTIKSDILKHYEDGCVNTKALLRNSKGRIAITTDMWTATNQKKGYMAVTAHFIDDEWRLQNRLIRFMHVPSPHTTKVLAEHLIDILVKDWGIDMKLSTLTLDNCSTNDSLISQLKTTLTPCMLLLRGELLQMRCAAHILHLIVKDGLEVITDAIEKIHNSVVFWTASPKRVEAFVQSVKDVEMEYSRKLVLDCRTRWNSTFKMIESTMLYKSVFQRTKAHDSNYKDLPCDEEWEVAQLVCEKLRFFYDATEVFSGTKYPTTNLFFPKVCRIRSELRKWEQSDNEVVKKMAVEMIKKFQKYWNETHGIMAVATILDPRYKMRLIEYMFPKIYNYGATYEIEKIRRLCNDLVDEYLLRNPILGSSTRHVSSSDESSALLQDDMDGFDDFVSTSGYTLSVKSDLDVYLGEPLVPRDALNFDILSWWKSNGFRFPVLNAMARDLLAIPVSTVASESAFSVGGRVISANRSRLHEKTVEALMCCQNWLWGESKGSCSTSLVGCSSYYEEDEDKEEDDALTIVYD